MPGVRQEHLISTVDGTVLYYERIGAGPGRPLVLCDGLVCDGHIWKYFIPAFSQDFEIIHGHYPGHGRSSEPPRFADVSPSRLADDVSAIAKHAALKDVVIVGHSMGVQVALEVWRRHRDIVKALIFICGSPGNIVQDFHEGPILGYAIPLLDLVGRIVPELVTRLWTRLPAQALTWMAVHSREVNRRLIKSSDLAPYFEGLNRVDFRLALRMLESAGRHDATPYLDEIDCPVLIFAGEEDRFTPPRRSEMMRDKIPNCELIMVRGGTHSLPIEQPDLVNLGVRRFLADRVAG